MDASGVEPETFRMRSERATNYAIRPIMTDFVAISYQRCRKPRYLTTSLT